MSNVSTAERKETLARLTAGEVAGLMNRSIEMTHPVDVKSAIKRLQDMFGGDSVLPNENAIALIDQLVKHMRESELNINFSAKNFFATSKLDPKYTTKYEKMRSAGAPAGDTRNKVEDLMFHYQTGAGVDSATSDKALHDASDRVQQMADLESDDFVGSIRPKYCTVNFAALSDGMGAQWGKSHLVLAEHLKPNMTFIHSDSFDIAGGNKIMVGNTFEKTTPLLVNGQLASFHEMTRLLVNMSKTMLDALIDSTSGVWGKGCDKATFNKKYSLGSTGYIEGHIHAEIHMNRDLKKIRINNAEINSQANSSKLKKRVAKFGSKFSVPIEFFD